jgi:hypothetical protein
MVPYPHHRSLVWHPYHHQQPYAERERSPVYDGPRGQRPSTGHWRDGRDDGMVELDRISSKLDMSGE